MLQRALFLDRDGVINVDRAYVHTTDDFIFINGIFDLVKHAQSAGFLIIVVTNQAGIGRGYYNETTFHDLMSWVREQFGLRGCSIDEVYFCPDHPEFGIGKYHRNCEFRKPAPGMILKAAKEFNIDLKHSIMIGDKSSDMQAAHSAGIETRILFTSSNEFCPYATAVIQDLEEAVKYFGH